MKIKTSELIDEKLDWAVSYALGHNPMKDFHSHGMTWRGWWETAPYIYTKPNEYRRLPRYSIDWSQGGPIIEQELIRVIAPTVRGVDWVARIKQPLLSNMNGWVEQIGPTPLIAAMRCYCASKLGDEVEIPEELA